MSYPTPSLAPTLPESKDEPTRKRWYGTWPGFVVDAKDPDKNGRLRVRVPQVYGKADDPDRMPDDQLPWAEPSFKFAGPDHGDIVVPEEKDGVLITFWGGISKHPVWQGSWFGTGDAPAEFTSSYDPTPKVRLVKTPTGQMIEMRWKDGEERIRLIDAAGNTFEMDQTNRRITVKTADGRQIIMEDNPVRILIDTGQGQTITLDANQINVEVVSGQNVLLGASSPAHIALVLENFLTAIFNIHTHIGNLGAPTSIPAPVAVVGTHSTVQTKAN